jgi:asparagine synthase (glutamine-hydrolysing)
MFRCQGLVDLSNLAPVPREPLPVESRDEVVALNMPGLQLLWKRGYADVDTANGVLALAVGQARDDESGTSGEATRWLERYDRFGQHAPANVGGGFAVAIVDFRKRLALLFVDRFSIETMCYRANPGTLAFADTARDVPGSSVTVDEQALYDYLYFHAIPAPRTVFRDVFRVEAAHAVTVTMACANSRRYWEPTFVEDDRRDLPGRLRSFVDLLQDSVNAEADGPATACFLSGGTDSSAVCGMLTRLRGEPVHAYSIGFQAEGYDEMAYAGVAARHFGLAHHAYYLTPEDLVSAIPEVAASLDQPFGNSSVLPAYCCALRAKQDGFDRMLAGDGGDELFAGNSRYGLQKFFQAYQILPNAVRRNVLEPPATEWPLFRRVPGFKQMGGYIRHARVPMPDRMETFNLLHRLDIAELLEVEFLRRIDTQSPLEHQRATWRAVRADSLINRMLAYDWKYTLADNDLPKVRYATQLAGVSVGYPLLDRVLTDFSLSLPPDWKLKRWNLRWFFKQALRDFLPPEILRKKKHGFGLPFGPWILRHSGLREFAEESLRGVARRGIIRPQFVGELTTARLQHAPGYYGEVIWILMMLEQWWRARESSPGSNVRAGSCDDPPVQRFVDANRGS